MRVGKGSGVKKGFFCLFVVVAVYMQKVSACLCGGNDPVENKNLITWETHWEELPQRHPPVGEKDGICYTKGGFGFR